MGLRMKNFDMGVHWKISFLAEGSWKTKTNVQGELPKKGRLGLFADLRWGLAKKRRVVFFWGRIDTPMQTVKHTYIYIIINFVFCNIYKLNVYISFSIYLLLLRKMYLVREASLDNEPKKYVNSQKFQKFHTKLFRCW